MNMLVGLLVHNKHNHDRGTTAWKYCDILFSSGSYIYYTINSLHTGPKCSHGMRDSYIPLRVVIICKAVLSLGGSRTGVFTECKFY